MRISDWSSDVCSSDLLRARRWVFCWKLCRRGRRRGCHSGRPAYPWLSTPATGNLESSAGAGAVDRDQEKGCLRGPCLDDTALRSGSIRRRSADDCRDVDRASLFPIWSLGSDIDELRHFGGSTITRTKPTVKENGKTQTR